MKREIRGEDLLEKKKERKDSHAEESDYLKTS
jgi:hypothetical protein